MILCGGRGKRLRPITYTIPKPLIKINEKTILEYQIELLKRYNISDIVLLVGWLSEQIVKYFGNGKNYNVNIYYSYEHQTKLLGTAGAIENAREFIKDTFIVLNGDKITNLNITEIVKFHKEVRGIGTIAIVDLQSRHGIIDTDMTNRITRFREKPLLPFKINAGIYVFEPNIVDYLPTVGSLEIDVFPKVIKQEKIYGYYAENIYCKDIGTYKDLEQVSMDLRKGILIT